MGGSGHARSSNLASVSHAPLQAVDTHHPFWCLGTSAAAGLPDQPGMTPLGLGQGNWGGL